MRGYRSDGYRSEGYRGGGYRSDSYRSKCAPTNFRVCPAECRSTVLRHSACALQRSSYNCVLYAGAQSCTAWPATSAADSCAAGMVVFRSERRP